MEEQYPEPQLLEYFIANKFCEPARSPSRRLRFLLGLLLELAGCLGFSRLLGSNCGFNMCLWGRHVNSSWSALLLSCHFGKSSWLPFLLLSGEWWAGHTDTHWVPELLSLGATYCCDLKGFPPVLSQAVHKCCLHFQIPVLINVVEKLFRGSGSWREVNNIGWKQITLQGGI